MGMLRLSCSDGRNAFHQLTECFGVFMNLNRTDYFGGTLDEAIEGFVRESKRSVIAFDDIVWWGRDLFSLDGGELEGFVRIAVFRILKGGARAARLVSASRNYGWERLPEYDSATPEEMTEKLVR